MTRGLDIPKAAPESVARAIFDGVEQGQEEIFPDPLSRPGAKLAQRRRQGTRAQYAALRQTDAVGQSAP